MIVMIVTTNEIIETTFLCLSFFIFSTINDKIPTTMDGNPNSTFNRNKLNPQNISVLGTNSKMTEQRMPKIPNEIANLPDVFTVLYKIVMSFFSGISISSPFQFREEPPPENGNGLSFNSTATYAFRTVHSVCLGVRMGAFFSLEIQKGVLPPSSFPLCTAVFVFRQVDNRPQFPHLRIMFLQSKTSISNFGSVLQPSQI